MRRRSLREAAVWAGAVTLVALAWYAKHPYLLPLRAVEVPAVSLLAGFGLWRLQIGARKAQPRRAARCLLTTVLLAALLLALGGDVKFRWQRHQVLAADATMRRLGAHFMVGYSDPDQVTTLAERGLIGGIYLGRQFVRGKSSTDLRSEIARLQSLRRRAGLPPLLIAADQEGGSVAHLSPPLPAHPSLASLVSASEPKSLAARARQYGEAQGAELAAVGVNLNFGPVVDLLPTAGKPRFDTHTLLSRRAIAADPATVAIVADAYAAGLAHRGVQATFKHFPGLGRVMVDTHHVAGRVDVPLARLRGHDWQPFRHAAAHGAAIMVGHVILVDIDAQAPASLSRPVIEGVLRRDWGFDGLIITDDLNMGAVYRLGIGHAASAALRAGADLLLISYDPDQYYAAISQVAHDYRAGLIDATVLAGGARRIASAAPESARIIASAQVTTSVR